MIRKEFQIVGYSNSGKTTLITKLIEAITKEGFRVGTIKHHGHAEIQLKSESSEVDSTNHRIAGASGTLVASEQEVSMVINNFSEMQLNDYLRMYEAYPFDFILIEGYKKEKYPKTVMVRSLKDEELLYECQEIKSAIIWEENIAQKWQEKRLFTVFHISQTDSYIQWFLQHHFKSEE